MEVVKKSMKLKGFVWSNYKHGAGLSGSGGLINITPYTILKYMIDTWLFAVLCLIFLSICAVGRAIHGPTRDDQLISVNTAITLAAGAALALSISWGNLFVLDVSIVLTALCYAGTIAYSRSWKGETP